MTTPTTPRKPRGSGRPTISDVAALAGVSPGAVSKVFNGTGRISEATAERIREAARKLSWRPNAAAIALRTARAQAIGLVLSSDTKVPGVGAGNMDFISGIESVLSPREYGLLLNIFISGQHDENHFYRTLAERQRMDGIILTNSMVGDTRPELMSRLGLPAVLVGAPWKPGAIEYVDADPPGAGIAETVDHLVGLGHERIAFVSGPKDFVLPVLRREAFVQRLADHGRQPHSVIAVEYSPPAPRRRPPRSWRARTRPPRSCTAPTPWRSPACAPSRPPGCACPTTSPWSASRASRSASGSTRR
nr:hypothetical protein GCM10025730_39940 [Promicromonospora thailandica]